MSAGERMAEASAAYVGDRFFPSTLATVVPTPADFVHFPNWCSCLTPPRARSTFLSAIASSSPLDWSVSFTANYRVVDQARGLRQFGARHPIRTLFE